MADIRVQREKNGVQFLEMMTAAAGAEKETMQAVATLIDAGIAYLSLLEENCQMYNGIDIQSDAGWEQITGGIDALIDMMVK